MQGVGHISGEYVRFRDQPPRELAIARIAERQHNLIRLSQLQALGLSADAPAIFAAPEPTPSGRTPGRAGPAPITQPKDGRRSRAAGASGAPGTRQPRAHRAPYGLRGKSPAVGRFIYRDG